jgi:hypothetical protein
MPTLPDMRATPILILLSLCAVATPALADPTYPVSGKWGQSTSTKEGPVDCTKLRTIDFKGERRFDSGGSIRDFRVVSVAPSDTSFKVSEEFRTGQVNGRNTITLRQADKDHLELAMQHGGTLKLRLCQ